MSKTLTSHTAPVRGYCNVEYRPGLFCAKKRTTPCTNHDLSGMAPVVSYSPILPAPPAAPTPVRGLDLDELRSLSPEAYERALNAVATRVSGTWVVEDMENLMEQQVRDLFGADCTLAASWPDVPTTNRGFLSFTGTQTLDLDELRATWEELPYGEAAGFGIASRKGLPDIRSIHGKVSFSLDGVPGSKGFKISVSSTLSGSDADQVGAYIAHGVSRLMHSGELMAGEYLSESFVEKEALDSGYTFDSEGNAYEEDGTRFTDQPRR